MASLTAFSNPLFLGFDDMERVLERVSKATNDGYPPYNIERISAEGECGALTRITVAVAGFAREELEVSVEENQLLVKGRQSEDNGRDFLYRGIAARQFQRTFALAEGIEVLGANLKDGLLSIELARPPRERIVRKIEISSGNGQA